MSFHNGRNPNIALNTEQDSPEGQSTNNVTERINWLIDISAVVQQGNAPVLEAIAERVYKRLDPQHQQQFYQLYKQSSPETIPWLFQVLGPEDQDFLDREINVAFDQVTRELQEQEYKHQQYEQENKQQYEQENSQQQNQLYQHLLQQQEQQVKQQEEEYKRQQLQPQQIQQSQQDDEHKRQQLQSQQIQQSQQDEHKIQSNQFQQNQLQQEGEINYTTFHIPPFPVRGTIGKDTFIPDKPSQGGLNERLIRCAKLRKQYQFNLKEMRILRSTMKKRYIEAAKLQGEIELYKRSLKLSEDKEREKKENRAGEVERKKLKKISQIDEERKQREKLYQDLKDECVNNTLIDDEAEEADEDEEEEDDESEEEEVIIKKRKRNRNNLVDEDPVAQ